MIMKKIINYFFLFLPVIVFSQRAKLYKGLPEKSYYKNGNLRVVRDFNEEQLVGYKTYYKNGELRSNHTFNSKGYHDGIANFYYPNGKAKTVWKYKKGVVKKRTDYNLKGEVIKKRDNKTLKRIRLCNDVLPYGKGYLGWTYKRATQNSKLGFYDEAIEDYHYIFSKSDLKELPFLAEKSVYHNLAITYTHLEDYDNALKYDFKAFSLDPQNQSVLNNIGWLLLEVKDYDLSLEYLDKCLAINPENYHAFYNKSFLYLEKGDYETALSFINKTIADERSHKYSKKNIFKEKTIWTVRGELYYRLEKYEDAITDFKKALEENPINSLAHLFLSKIYKEKKELDKACEYLYKAKEYKYDRVYNTNEVENMTNEICSTN